MTLAHVLVLAWLGLRAPQTNMVVPPEPQVVEAFLVPPPPPRQPRSGQPPPGVTPFRPRIVLPVAPSNVVPLPAPPSTAAVGQAGPAAPPVINLPRNDGVRGTLRQTTGCESQDLHALTPAERAACDRRFGLAADRFKQLPVAIDPAKQAEFDRAAAANARARREREGSMSNPMTTCTGVNANFGIACNPNRQ